MSNDASNDAPTPAATDYAVEVLYFKTKEEINDLPALPNVSRFSKDLDEGHARELAHAMVQAGGFIDPLLLWRDGEGTVWLAAGQHRRLGASMLNENPGAFDPELPENYFMPIWGNVVECSRSDIFALSWEENSKRKPTNFVDNAFFALGLHRDEKMQLEEIGRLMRLQNGNPTPVARVSLLINMAKTLPIDVLKDAHQGKLNERTVTLLYQLKKGRPANKKAQVKARAGLSAAAIKSRVKGLKEGSITPANIEAEVKEKQRTSGKAVKRTYAEIVSFLDATGTNLSVTLAEWVKGGVSASDKRMVAILKWIDKNVETAEWMKLEGGGAKGGGKPSKGKVKVPAAKATAKEPAKPKSRLVKKADTGTGKPAPRTTAPRTLAPVTTPAPTPSAADAFVPPAPKPGGKARVRVRVQS